jgi:hypothetical protein
MVGFFARLKGRDGPNKIKSKKHGHLDQLANQKPQKPRWDDAWTRTTVEPEEVQDLIRRCTEELKARGMTPCSHLHAPTGVLLRDAVVELALHIHGTYIGPC